jgi:hypothetical protein
MGPSVSHVPELLNLVTLVVLTVTESIACPQDEWFSAVALHNRLLCLQFYLDIRRRWCIIRHRLGSPYGT